MSFSNERISPCVLAAHWPQSASFRSPPSPEWRQPSPSSSPLAPPPQLQLSSAAAGRFESPMGSCALRCSKLPLVSVLAVYLISLNIQLTDGATGAVLSLSRTRSTSLSWVVHLIWISHPRSNLARFLPTNPQMTVLSCRRSAHINNHLLFVHAIIY